MPLIGLCAACVCLPSLAAESLSHGYFKDVQIDRPSGQAHTFVIWLGGDTGNRDDQVLAQRLVAQGTMVARVDTRKLTDALEVDNGACLSADGSIENLSRHIQAFYKLPTYLTPILIGDGGGAALAYAMAAQAQPDALVGVVSLGFCPVFQANKPMCTRAGVQMLKRADGTGFDMQPIARLSVPWIALQDPTDAQCGAAATRAFTTAAPQAALATVPVAYRQPGLDAAMASLGQHQTLVAPPPPACPTCR